MAASDRLVPINMIVQTPFVAVAGGGTCGPEFPWSQTEDRERETCPIPWQCLDHKSGNATHELFKNHSLNQDGAERMAIYTARWS